MKFVSSLVKQSPYKVRNKILVLLETSSRFKNGLIAKVIHKNRSSLSENIYKV